MRKFFHYFVLTFSMLFFYAAYGATDLYPFPTGAQQNQFRTLTQELRCLVCQNQNLADSQAGLAGDLRAEIATLIRANQSNQEILNYLTARYGDYILYKPPLMENTYILWFAPFLLLVFGMSILFFSLCKKGRSA